MKLSIRHETHYEYNAPLRYALQHLCLTPQANAHPGRWRPGMSARAGPAVCAARRWGNLAHSWSMARQRDARHVFRGSVTAHGVVRTASSVELVDEPAAPTRRCTCAAPLTAADAALADLGRAHLAKPPMPIRCSRWTDAVAARVVYQAGATHVGTTAAEALALGAGVCQDQGHVFIARLPRRRAAGALRERLFPFAERAPTSPATPGPPMSASTWPRAAGWPSTSRIAARWTSATCAGHPASTRRPARRCAACARRRRGGCACAC